MILTDLEVTKNAAVKSVHTNRDKRAFSLAELIIAIALLSIFGVIAARMFLRKELSSWIERLF
jgi:prepilin-type N-terminal cleavage/methylation domain-containing protein